MNAPHAADPRDAQAAAFIADLRSARRLAAHTVSAYGRDVARLTAHLKTIETAQWRDLSAAQARGFAAKLHQSGLSGRSIARMLASARALYRYLLDSGAAEVNPFAGVTAPKSPRPLPKTLSVDEVSALLAHHDGSALSIRDHAMLELFYSSGLRLAELAALDADGIDFQLAEVRVTGKGNRQRMVPVGRCARAALEGWLARRDAIAQADEGALFVNNNGRRLGARGIQYRLDHWAKKHALGRRLHPHMLRHSFASHVLASSGDLRAVQEMLGHANLATTQIYTHLDFQHLARVYDQAHPRAGKSGK